MNAPTPPSQFNAGKRYASKLEYALDAARRGFRVFPLLPDSKRPPSFMTEWQFAATRDEAKIREWFTDKDWNYAIVLDHRAAADADKRSGGLETLRELVKAQGLDKPEHLTMVVKTHSGGYHLIWRIDDSIRLKGKPHVFGPGVDLKTGSNQYLVGPGSEINGNKYVLLHDREIAPMPAGMLALAQAAGKPSEKNKAAGERIADETDQASNARRNGSKITRQ